MSDVETTVMKSGCEDEDVCDNSVLRRLIGRSVGHTLGQSESISE